MLRTVEAILEPPGTLRLLEEVRVTSPMRVLVTLLEPSPRQEDPEQGDPKAILQFARDHPWPPECRRSPEVMEAQIEEERHAWD